MAGDGNGAVEHPFAVLRRALATSGAAATLDVCPAGVRRDATWLPATALADPGTVRDLLDRMCTGQGIRHRPLGAVTFLSAVAYGTVTPAAFGLYLLDRVADPSPDNLWFRTGGDAVRFDRPALVRPVTALLDGSAHPDAVMLPDRPTLTRWTGGRLVATLTPVVAAVRSVSRVGPRTLWSFVADSVHFTTLLAAMDAGHDLPAAWRRAADLVAAMAATAPGMWARPRPFPVRAADLDALWLVRGACCFLFREGSGFCATCPLVPDPERHDRLAAWFRTRSTG